MLAAVAMSKQRELEFFLLQYVPNVLRQERVNIGLVMIESGELNQGFADARFTREWKRVRCMDPDVDVEMLEAMERDIRQQLTTVQDRGTLLSKIQESFSNLVELSPTMAYQAEDPQKEIEEMASVYLDVPRYPSQMLPSGRQRIVRRMEEAFQQAGVWELMTKKIAAEPYTRKGDPLKIDFGYRVGTRMKMFHAVSLAANIDQAITLAYRYPKVADGMSKGPDQLVAELTAVVDDDLRWEEADIDFAVTTLKENGVQVGTAAEMPLYAAEAKRDLRA